MAIQPVLIGGSWTESAHEGTFQSHNPTNKHALPDEFPISSWADCDAALTAAAAAFRDLRGTAVDRLEQFLNRYAHLLEENEQAICEIAHVESGFPLGPRLRENEMPRTINQLRLAAAAAGEGSWRVPTIDTKAGIRSYYAGLGPVAVFGPNNFPLAFNGASGGDFAAAIAAGCPVIVKANPAQPATTRELAKLAQQAVDDTGMPPATVQLLYHMQNATGERLIGDPRLASAGFTGSRRAGLKLKEIADKAGKPIYLELSSINPVVFLPGVLAERGDELAAEFTSSCLMGAGQFCTNPGLVFLLADETGEQFIETARQRFAAAPVGTLLSEGGEQALTKSVEHLIRAGAEVLVSGGDGSNQWGYSHPNTLLMITAEQFLATPEAFQMEAFGNASLIVKAKQVDQICHMLEALEGNLTGSIYSAADGSDDPAYDLVAFSMRNKVGRLINDKMPTGVAVSSAMNHGGPFPATGHPGFTAVGIPASIHRFAMLQCFDNVRARRLPRELHDANPTGRTWRLIDGEWTQKDVSRHP